MKLILVEAAPMVPPAVQAMAAPKFQVVAVDEMEAPVAVPALLKFKIAPPVVFNAEENGPPTLVLHTLPLIVPLVPK